MPLFFHSLGRYIVLKKTFFNNRMRKTSSAKWERHFHGKGHFLSRNPHYRNKQFCKSLFTKSCSKIKTAIKSLTVFKKEKIRVKFLIEWGFKIAICLSQSYHGSWKHYRIENAMTPFWETANKVLWGQSTRRRWVIKLRERQQIFIFQPKKLAVQYICCLLNSQFRL